MVLFYVIKLHILYLKIKLGTAKEYNLFRIYTISLSRFTSCLHFLPLEGNTNVFSPGGSFVPINLGVGGTKVRRAPEGHSRADERIDPLPCGPVIGTHSWFL